MHLFLYRVSDVLNLQYLLFNDTFEWDCKYLFINLLHFREANFDPDPFKANELKECNITKEDYVEQYHWVGTGNRNCTDPELLRNHITLSVKDLRIQKVIIETFDQEFYEKYFNDTSLEWTKIFIESLRVCYTMKLPKDLVKLGIYQITLRFYDYPELEAYIHQEGLLFTDMPDSFLHVLNLGYTVVVSHEFHHMQNYNEEPCIKDPDYKLDKCRFDYMIKVDLNIIILDIA